MSGGRNKVDWNNAENDKKLFHCILMATKVGVNYDEVAKAFGDGVSASSLSQRINKIRREVRDKGVTSTATASIPASSQRKVTTASKAKTSARNNDASDDTEGEIRIKQEPTTEKRAKGTDKIITGRVTKARKSPRQSSVGRKDYQKMLDPYNDFGDVVDGDGDAIFDRQGVSSEDSMDSDKEYNHEREAPAAGPDANAGQGEV